MSPHTTRRFTVSLVAVLGAMLAVLMSAPAAAAQPRPGAGHGSPGFVSGAELTGVCVPRSNGLMRAATAFWFSGSIIRGIA